MRFLLFVLVTFAFLVVGPIGSTIRLLLLEALSALHRPWMRSAELGGLAWEVVAGFVTAPSTTQTALTMSTGDSLAVRSTGTDKPVWLAQAWGDNQTAGTLRVKSPNLHDAVQGIRTRVTASDVVPLLPWGRPQRLRATDLLSVDLSGSATAGDIEGAALLFCYEDLPGIAGQFITPDELQKRGVNQLNVENTLALLTAGGWSGSEAINAEYDLMKANTDYALIGYLVDVECLAVAWRGAQTGNLRVGGPGNETLRHVTEEWFVRLSRGYNLPAIPVFNSNNRAGITIEGAQDENGADPLVTSIFVELSPR